MTGPLAGRCPGRPGGRCAPEAARASLCYPPAATREPIGRGLRPSVASPADLARMLSALGRERDIPNLLAMRRLIELERGWTIER